MQGQVLELAVAANKFGQNRDVVIGQLKIFQLLEMANFRRYAAEIIGTKIELLQLAQVRKIGGQLMELVAPEI